MPSLFNSLLKINYKNGGIFIMKIVKKRANGKGSAIYLGDNRNKPWGE